MDGGKTPHVVDNIRCCGRDFVDKAVARPLGGRLCFTATRGVCQEERIRRFHQRNRASGAQPEIASKAVREDIEDRLHGQAAEASKLRQGTEAGRSGRFFFPASGTVRPAYSFRMAPDTLPGDDALIAALAAHDLSGLSG